MEDNSYIVFYSKSANRPFGKGTGENLTTEDNESGKFNEINRISNFRQKFSNFWPNTKNGIEGDVSKSLFEADGRRWASLEHFFHYAKFRNTYPEFADTFTFDSKSKWSKNAGLAKQAGKAGKVNSRGKHYDPYTKKYKLNNRGKYTVREGFYDDLILRNNLQLISGWSKFSQNEKLKKALLATEDGGLYHYIKMTGSPAVRERWLWLEDIRKCLREFPDADPFMFNDRNIVDRYL